MRVLYERCGGLDIHKASIAACAVTTKNGKSEQETRRFGTMTADLLELAVWLKTRGIQQIAMESTGVYWKPVWNILEAQGFDLLLANAARRIRRTASGSRICTSTACCGRVSCRPDRFAICAI